MGALRHACAAAGFTLLAVIWMLPLPLHLSTHLPGPGIGDNAAFLWNFWWMRTALASGSDYFHTTFLFAPVGTDLTLHTHTALAAFAGATVLKGLPLVAALNVTTLAALSLNGFCTYLLAWRITRNTGAAVIAGVIFACSPYIATHLNGHYNLTMAWSIPLFALTLIEAGRGSWKWAVLSGVVLGTTFYIDYYYVVYELALALCFTVLSARTWSVTLPATTSRPRWLSVLVASVIVLDLAAIGVIEVTGGFSTRIGPVRLTARDIFNPLQLLWLFIALGLWMYFQPRVTGSPKATWSARRQAQLLAIIAASSLLIAGPLVWKGMQLVIGGAYVTQQYYWRNAPVGIDIATLVTGNPMHGISGSLVRTVYARFGIDVIESCAWLGIGPIALSIYALRRQWNDDAVRTWAVIGAVFFIWALGSHVSAFGHNTAMMVPGLLLRYIPIVSNARMPGRAMVMVYLALAILGAIGAAEYGQRRRRSTVALAAIAMIVFAECLVAPFPIVPIGCPPIYQTLRDRPERGAVAELPLGVSDGFGAVTPIDNRVLVCQAVHERPLVGGFVARLSPQVLAAYREDSLLAAWLRLSGDAVAAAPPDSQSPSERLTADGIDFIMLNRTTASAALREYVDALPLTQVAEDERYTLYVRNQVALR